MPKVLMLTRSLKVTLISAQENIDETPGRIQRIQVERGRSRYPLQDGPESKERRRPRQATFSHLSVRTRSTVVRSVRWRRIRNAPVCAAGFELAATGKYTMQRLSDVLKERGLRMRLQANRSAGPISAKCLASSEGSLLPRLYQLQRRGIPRAA